MVSGIDDKTYEKDATSDAPQIPASKHIKLKKNKSARTSY